MSGSLDRPMPAYSDPGPDQQPSGAMDLAEQFLALAGQEGPTSPDIQQAVQMLLAGLHQIATNQAGQSQQGPPQQISNASAPLDQPGPNEAQAVQPPPGQAWASLH